MTSRAAWKLPVRLIAPLVVVAAFLGVAWVVPAEAASVTQTPSASWSPWKACAGKPKDNCASVRAIVRVGSTVYIGGDFSQLRSPDGKQFVAISNLAAIDGAGNPVSSFTHPTLNGTVFTLSTDDSSLFVGGAFTKLGTAGALHLLKFSLSGVRDGTFKAGTSGTVYGSVLSGGWLYVGGKFTSVQGQTRTNLAAVSPSTGAVDPSWAPVATMIPNDTKPNDPPHNSIPIRTLAASPSGDRIYIGGDYDLVNNTARPAVAALSPSTGAILTAFAPKAVTKGAQVMSIVPVDAGEGRNAAAVIVAAGGLANKAWKLGASGSVNWTINTDGDVQAAAVVGTTIYFGGHFTCVVSCYNDDTTTHINRMHIVAYNYNATTSPLDNSWMPSLPPIFSPYYYGVWVLKAYGTSLYAGGVFNSVVVNGTPYKNSKFVRFGTG